MATGKFLFMSLDVDRVLISISKYIRVLELAGDFHRERTDATDYAEVILQEAAKETVFKVDRNKWNVLRQLLELLTFKLFHTASQGSADTQRGPDGQAAQELKTNPFVRLFKSFDKIRVKDCHRGEAGTQQGQRASPAGDSRGPASPAGENASADVLDELSRKEEEVQDLRRQRDFFEGELRRSAPEIMSLREALEESKRQREYFLGQWSAEKRRLDETLGEFEKLQSEHVQLVTKLEEEREANRELHARLKKLDLVHKQQEETKELVRQISTRQEELFEEIRDIVPTADQAELERLQLPDDVRELCLKIQYFIGGNAQAFGRQLLGRHFAVEEYESEPGSCVCFATLPVFWRMVRKWRETSESGVSLEQLQSACRALTPDPTQCEHGKDIILEIRDQKQSLARRAIIQ